MNQDTTDGRSTRADTRRKSRRAALLTAASKVFAMHCFLRSSLLFLYDGVSDRTLLRMIDLPRTFQTEKPLEHCVPWVDGNNEDGYLVGVDHLIAIFEGLLESLQG